MKETFQILEATLPFHFLMQRINFDASRPFHFISLKIFVQLRLEQTGFGLPNIYSVFLILSGHKNSNYLNTYDKNKDG